MLPRIVAIFEDQNGIHIVVVEGVTNLLAGKNPYRLTCQFVPAR